MKKFRQLKTPYMALLLVFTVAIALSAWLYYHPRSDKSLDFQAYQPNALPAGIQVTGHEVTVATHRSGNAPDLKTISYYTNTSDFYIGEQKSSPEDFAKLTSSCGALKPDNATCTTHTSAGGQSYQLQTSFDDKSVAFSQTVSWLKGTTRFWINLNNGQVQKYSPESWGGVVDSFTPVDYSKEPVKRVKSSPGA